MPSSKAAPAAPTYTIFVDGKIERGTARELMERMRADAAKRSDAIAKMDTRRYASAIVEDADVLLDRKLFAFLEKEPYATEYDRALRYLAEIDAGGVRILSRSDG